MDCISLRKRLREMNSDELVNYIHLHYDSIVRDRKLISMICDSYEQMTGDRISLSGLLHGFNVLDVE